MLTLLKRKSEAAAAPASPSWHPNFRDFGKLPDIKVVRTAFFVNGIALTVALAAGIFVGSYEWQLHVLQGQIGEAQRRIAQDKPASDRAIAQYRKFQAEEARLKEVDAFVKSRPSTSDLLLHLGSTLPPNMALDGFDLRENGMLLRISVRGAPDVASGLTTSYRDQLAADKALGYFGEATIANLATNPNTGRLVVEILLPAKPEKK